MAVATPVVFAECAVGIICYVGETIASRVWYSFHVKKLFAPYQTYLLTGNETAVRHAGSMWLK